MRVDRQLEKRANREHPGMLSGLSGQKKQEILSALYAREPASTVVHHTQQISKFQSAPVPPPDFLEGYNQQIPDGANRLFILVEKQTDHRIKQESDVIATQNKATLRGQWMAIAVVAVLCAIAYHAMLLGHIELAGFIFTSTIVGVASVFITGKTSMRKNLTDKRPPQ